MAERPAGAAGGGRRTDTSGTGQEGPAERAGGAERAAGSGAPERPGVVEGQVVGSGAPESGHTPRAGAEPEEPATVRAHRREVSTSSAAMTIVGGRFASADPGQIANRAPREPSPRATLPNSAQAWARSVLR